MKNFPILSALLLAATLAAAGCGGTKDTYANPLATAEGDTLRIADPFVYKHEGVYYLTGTTGNDGFDYYTSPDLVTWRFGGTLYRRPADHFGTDCFWAPEVKYYRGRFYRARHSAHVPRGERHPRRAVPRPAYAVVRARIFGHRLPYLRR